eukprot:CAMPEP_0171745438 /NCGR_PEP_ID=MMETSP0991-20121206/38153_1 /TAXON_ID=483369 /ORGANISM="non described non described, Strain CCMP2098" /LENGTH=83 /DNA_ID=CAMNT_0012344895 /DNA_START=65 /DNA_END=312 /DNA_ORIENTATION=+
MRVDSEDPATAATTTATDSTAANSSLSPSSAHFVPFSPQPSFPLPPPASSSSSSFPQTSTFKILKRVKPKLNATAKEFSFGGL